MTLLLNEFMALKRSKCESRKVITVYTEAVMLPEQGVTTTRCLQNLLEEEKPRD